MVRIKLLILLTLAALLAACQPAGAGDPGDIEGLAGTEWVLASMNGQEPVEGTTVTLAFEEEQLTGVAGCNDYGGAYTATAEGELTIPELVQTEKACLEPEGIMEQESAYLEALRSAASYQVTGDQLELQNLAGETILTFTRQETGASAGSAAG